MNALAVAPLVVPLATAAVGLLFIRHVLVQKAIAIIGASALLGVAVALLAIVWDDGIQAFQMGGWPAPFGITIVVDTFSAVMLLLSAIVGLASVVYSWATIDEERTRFGYYPLVAILLMGVNGAFITGDLFNLYVWFEVLLISSFVLLGLGGTRPQVEGAIKYVSLNLIASVLFLAGLGLIYGVAGTLNMADLALTLRATDQDALLMAIAMLFLVAFGIKAAAFPLFFWLPASYHTPPVAVSALFAGLLTKVGVYALIRVFTLIFTQDTGFTHELILVIAGFTMVTGVLGAVAQNDMRRILSFHIVSQIGYMMMGLGLYTQAALMGSVFYIAHHIIVKTNLFLVAGIAHRYVGSYELKRAGGLYRAAPGVAVLFVVPAMSLAGIPPFSGFFAKLALVQASLDADRYAIAGVALGVGLLTLFSMAKIWNEVFWKAAPAPHLAPARRLLVPLVAPATALAILTILYGLGANPVFAVAERAAGELIDPSAYIEAVLGETS